MNQRNAENSRKSPPNKKTKKMNLDFTLDSPAFKESTDKLGDSADKFLFLGKIFAFLLNPISPIKVGPSDQQ